MHRISQESLGFEEALDKCTAISEPVSEVELRCERSGSLKGVDNNRSSRQIRIAAVVHVYNLSLGWILIQVQCLKGRAQHRFLWVLRE